ncbi:MAG: hypothetical protein Q9227_007515 [Pyrenula ochraceoflavens]
MQKSSVAWAVGSATLLFSAASTTLNAVFGVSIPRDIAAVRILALIALALNALCIPVIVIILFVYTKRVMEDPLGWGSIKSWTIIGGAALTSFAAAVTSAIDLVWAIVKLNDIPKQISTLSSKSVLVSWFAVWGCSVIFQVAIYGLLASWIRYRCHGHSTDSSSLDFGIDVANQPTNSRPVTRDTARSFRSQDPTLASPPRTPTNAGKSLLHAVSTNSMRPANSRTQLVRQGSYRQDSARSSTDYAGSEMTHVDNGFDKWDTSSVGRAMRETLQSSPPVTRGGLETIPGSRPESPAHALDGPFLPDSPVAVTAPKAVEVTAPHSRHHSVITPPSSPPNFSRPTSRQYPPSSIPLPATPSFHSLRGPTPQLSSSQPSSPLPPEPSPMEEYIHPLFRSSSPTPPPNASPGTTITASPNAGHTINSHTLNRMRSSSLRSLHSAVSPPSPLGEAESINEPGSPGPSVIDEGEEMEDSTAEEAELSLPSFVLSAGQRSSLVGYGKRKSVRGRESSSDISKSPSFE